MDEDFEGKRQGKLEFGIYSKMFSFIFNLLSIEGKPKQWQDKSD